MASKPANILIISEGAVAEEAIMRKLQKAYGLDGKFEYTSYKTNIYVLYNQMFADKDISVLDIQSHLRTKEEKAYSKATTDDERVKIALMIDILSRNYSEIYLIFDIESPQDEKYCPLKIRRMTMYFNDATDMGKLYISYPMVESFYHMASIPDVNYNTYTTQTNMLVKKQYKQRVRAESRNKKYFDRFAINEDECTTIIEHNITKAWHITTKTRDKLIPDSIDILEAQL